MFNLGKTEAEMYKLKTNEIRNGRLAMLAMLGFGAQAVMTGKGPFQVRLKGAGCRGSSAAAPW